MAGSVFDGCGEGCGWTAAVLAALAWGTFGVPLKTNANVEVNFFVMQSYKTIVCFLTSWLVVFLGEPVRFTAWGIVSGLFWVPGAACGIYAIRQAGLAISVGTWSSIQLCTSFLFGIVIFEESVRSIVSTVLAFCFLMIGLIGMSLYADPSQQQKSTLSQTAHSSLSNVNYEKLTNGTSDANGTVPSATDKTLSFSSTDDSLPTHDTQATVHSTESVPPLTGRRKRKSSKTGASGTNTLHSSSPASNTPAQEDGRSSPPQFSDASPVSGGVLPMEMELAPIPGELSDTSEASLPLLNNQHALGDQLIEVHDKERKESRKKGIIVLFGRFILTKRQMGILGAVVNGAWGGLNLIPLHYAHRDQGIQGATYLISYATGSMIVCIAIWIGLFAYHFHRISKKPRHHQQSPSSSLTQRSSQSDQPSSDKTVFQEALEALPAWHVRQLGIPGFMAGTFYSIGNFCSILAVAYLGQGIGFSVCQAQLLISGLWGVFYFEEIKGRDIVTKWFISASMTVAGIIWLSYEHVGGEDGH